MPVPSPHRRRLSIDGVGAWLGEGCCGLAKTAYRKPSLQPAGTRRRLTRVAGAIIARRENAPRPLARCDGQHAAFDDQPVLRNPHTGAGSTPAAFTPAPPIHPSNVISPEPRSILRPAASSRQQEGAGTDAEAKTAPANDPCLERSFSSPHQPPSRATGAAVKLAQWRDAPIIVLRPASARVRRHSAMQPSPPTERGAMPPGPQLGGPSGQAAENPTPPREALSHRGVASPPCLSR